MISVEDPQRARVNRGKQVPLDGTSDEGEIHTGRDDLGDGLKPT